MNSGVNRAPVFISQLLRKSSHELGTTRCIELLRQNHHHFSTQLRVAATSTFYCIPQRRSILGPSNSSVSSEFGGHKDFFIDNIIPPQVRVHPAGALVTNPLSGTI